LSLAELRALGAGIGADVPSQLEPAPSVVTGAGEGVEPIELRSLWLVLVPTEEGLSTASVYAELDRRGGARTGLDPGALRALAGAAATTLARYAENDLEAAALSLRPELQSTLDGLSGQGALTARLSGSGPTAFGIFADSEAAIRAAASVSGALVTRTRPSPASQ
jgi:4-diphosphocytidyl-2-C-methyl-D-erythritol kinase